MTLRNDDDIESVWNQATEGFGAEEFAGLVRAGVPKAWLAAHLYADFWPGALDIAVQNGKWQPMFRGDRAIIVPVRSPDGELIDLVAFRIGTPKAVWLFAGEGRFLGEDAIFEAEFLHQALPVREHPLAWLAQGCTGLVILSWKQLWPFWFAGVPALQFDDRSFAQLAKEQMQRPFRIPPVMVPAA